MSARSKVALLVAGALALSGFALLAGCSPASSSKSASSQAASPAASSQVASSGAASSGSASQSGSPVAAKNTATMKLEYSAGTGYEWTYRAEPEGVVELVDQKTVDLAAEEKLDGGPLRQDFTFRAVKPGEVVITFDLVRGWESGKPAETQTYAYTVGDNLGMILNPYKSDFVLEPE